MPALGRNDLEYVMDSLVSDVKRLLIKQEKSWTEMLTSFETKNRYRVMSEASVETGFIAEESSALARAFMPWARACKLHVFDASQRAIGLIDKPFRWFFQEMTVLDKGRRVGSVVRRFGILTRRLDILDEKGHVILEIATPIWHPWTFPVTKSGRQVALIQKKWSGLGREMFSAADSFGIEFQEPMTNDTKAILVAATMLVDLIWFEKKNSIG